jgi:hypothetical protein
MNSIILWWIGGQVILFYTSFHNVSPINETPVSNLRLASLAASAVSKGAHLTSDCPVIVPSLVLELVPSFSHLEKPKNNGS